MTAPKRLVAAFDEGTRLMLLIPCPWCGARDEIEFRYGGQAHLAYPADPEALSDAEWADFLFMRDNPKGRGPSGGCTRRAAAGGSTRSATRRHTG